MAFIFPSLWAEDSLLFDDSLERKQLIQQFDDIIGEIGYTADQDSNITRDDITSARGTRAYRPLSSSLRTIEEAITPHISKRKSCHQSTAHEFKSNTSSLNINWSCSRGTNHEEKWAIEGNSFHPRITEINRQTAPSGAEECLQVKVLPRGNHSTGLPPIPADHKFIAIVKLPDGNLYMATKASPKAVTVRDDPFTNNRASTPVGARSAGSTYDQDPSVPSASTAGSPTIVISDGARHLPQRQLFPNEDTIHQTVPTPSKILQRDIALETNPGINATGIPSEIIDDLVVIRTIRRSAYADGDCLVEVRPTSMPESPTMFAYRGPSGDIRVPMDMQCNRKALFTYRNTMKVSATPTPQSDTESDDTFASFKYS